MGVRPLARRTRIALGVALATGFAIAWVVPPLGVVLAWPILFLVPGWVLVSRVVPQVPTPGRLGLAIVTSVFVSAHLVNVVARADGFSRTPVLVSVVLLASATVVLIRIRHPWLASSPEQILRLAPIQVIRQGNHQGQ